MEYKKIEVSIGKFITDMSSAAIQPFTGKWVQNKSLSDDYQDVLEAQGVGWVTRKVVANATLHLDLVEGDQAGSLKETTTTVGKNNFNTLYFDSNSYDAEHTLYGKMSYKSYVNEEGVVKVEAVAQKGTQGEWNTITTWSIENDGARFIRTVEFFSKKLNRVFKYVFDKN
jgi:hypothetical protein